jgi:hypothetical protein
MSAWKEWKNNLGETRPWDMINPNTEFVEDSVAESRMRLCLSCPELIKTTKQCKKCGCFMHLKTKLEKAVCPIGKW